MSQYVCTASQLAHYVVDKCTKDGKPVSNLQLQKILYFIQAVYCKRRTVSFSRKSSKHGPTDR